MFSLLAKAALTLLRLDRAEGNDRHQQEVRHKNDVEKVSQSKTEPVSAPYNFIIYKVVYQGNGA
jgi:hypothetical protein